MRVADGYVGANPQAVALGNHRNRSPRCHIFALLHQARFHVTRLGRIHIHTATAAMGHLRFEGHTRIVVGGFDLLKLALRDNLLGHQLLGALVLRLGRFVGHASVRTRVAVFDILR